MLKKVSAEDYKIIFETCTKDEIMTLLGIVTEADYAVEKNNCEQGYSMFNKSLVYFKLIDKVTSKVIGECGFHTWYTKHNRAEVGYKLFFDEYKRKGFMKEALAAVIDYGFTVMQLHRIEAMIGPDNEASLKLIAAFNFKEEGVLRQHYFTNNRYEDSVVFGLLSEDYFSKNK